MPVRRHPTPRDQRPDLLVRPAGRGGGPEGVWAAMLDPAAPLAVLAELRARGLISRPEYERQKAKDAETDSDDQPTLLT